MAILLSVLIKGGCPHEMKSPVQEEGEKGSKWSRGGAEKGQNYRGKQQKRARESDIEKEKFRTTPRAAQARNREA